MNKNFEKTGQTLKERISAWWKNESIYRKKKTAGG